MAKEKTMLVNVEEKELLCLVTFLFASRYFLNLALFIVLREPELRDSYAKPIFKFSNFLLLMSFIFCIIIIRLGNYSGVH